jgi:alpha-tubulin suppressor-like RCC1 family protein
MFETCALLQNKTVSCWEGMSPPAVLARLNNVVHVVAGSMFNCAVVLGSDHARSLWCWGRDFNKLLFNTSDYVSPRIVSGLPGNVISAVAGENHVCALVGSSASSNVTGDVICWGANEYGQLGQGYTNGTWDFPAGSAAPLRVKALRNVTALFGGFDSVCAVLPSRQVLCWGFNVGGMLGTGAADEAVTLPKMMQGVYA